MTADSQQTAPVPRLRSPGTPQRVHVIRDGLAAYLPDIDPQETGEWLDSFDAVLDTAGQPRARYLMLRLLQRASERHVGVPSLTSTDYVNTIPTEREPWFPGDEETERAYRALDPVERRDDGAPRAAAGHRRRRAHLDLRLLGDALRGRVQPLLPRARTTPAAATRSSSRATPRPASTPGRSWRAG